MAITYMASLNANNIKRRRTKKVKKINKWELFSFVVVVFTTIKVEKTFFSFGTYDIIKFVRSLIPLFFFKSFSVPKKKIVFI